GPVGLLQFASNPRSAFPADFSGNAAVWTTGALANVHALGDFGLIVLVSGAPESARAWMEQADSYAVAGPLGPPPTVAVISARAQASGRPYYAGPSTGSLRQGQLPPKGLVVGLGGAAAYEAAMAAPGAATSLWPALGGGLLAAALIILLGNLFFAITGG